MPIADTVTHRLVEICGPRNVLTHAEERIVYECDAYPLAKAIPDLVVFPRSTDVAAEVLSLLAANGVAFVPRGSGTSLAGGCLVPPDSVCISTTRMNRILEIDPECRCAVVEAGVVNDDISAAVAGLGLTYEPDPSSQTTCTIGGNVANNAGGPHTLKYGVTAQHVMGLTAVLAGGEVLRLGGKTSHGHGFDLKSVFVGSEGTLGLLAEVTVKLMPVPQACRTVLAMFDRMEDAADAVSRVIAQGVLPAAMEIMDQAVINIVEDAYGYGLPRDAGAALIVEIDGIEAGLDRQLNRILEICKEHNVKSLKNATSPQDRELLWKARKTAFGALGRLASNCITQDGVVPRSKLSEILSFIQQIARKYDLQVASNFHAGDGNIHPNFLFDVRDADHVERVLNASNEILAECVRLGGSITGEHGVGVEKIDMLKLMYSDADLTAQQRLRDVFDPRRLANPNKVFSDHAALAHASA